MAQNCDLVNVSIKAFDSKLDASDKLQENKLKISTEAVIKNAEKLEKSMKSSINTLGNKISEIRSDNDYMRKSINIIKLQMAQMTADNEKMSDLMENMKGLIEHLVDKSR